MRVQDPTISKQQLPESVHAFSELAGANYLSEALVALKVRHLKNFAVDKSVYVSAAVPDRKLAVDVLGPCETTAPSGGKVLGTASMKHRDLLQKGWLVVPLSQRELMNQMHKKTVIEWLAGMLAPVARDLVEHRLTFKPAESESSLVEELLDQ